MAGCSHNYYPDELLYSPIIIIIGITNCISTELDPVIRVAQDLACMVCTDCRVMAHVYPASHIIMLNRSIEVYVNELSKHNNVGHSIEML